MKAPSTAYHTIRQAAEILGVSDVEIIGLASKHALILSINIEGTIKIREGVSLSHPDRDRVFSVCCPLSRLEVNCIYRAMIDERSTPVMLQVKSLLENAQSLTKGHDRHELSWIHKTAIKVTDPTQQYTDIYRPDVEEIGVSKDNLFILKGNFLSFKKCLLDDSQEKGNILSAELVSLIHKNISAPLELDRSFSILQWFVDNNFDREDIRHTNGKRSVKHQIKLDLFENSALNFSEKSFSKTWQRLRDIGAIKSKSD